MKKIYLDKNGNLVGEGCPCSTAYVSEEDYEDLKRKYASEHDINASLRKALGGKNEDIAKLQMENKRLSDALNCHCNSGHHCCSQSVNESIDQIPH